MKILWKFLKDLELYLLFFLPTSFLVMLSWTVIAGTLYYCSDRLPLFEFIPPFVHSHGFGDYYIAEPSIVWAIWYLFLGLMLVIPYFLTIISEKRFKEL